MISHANPVTAILAGGLATRLSERATSVPKSLLPVGGQPFIAHQLRGLAAQGFAEVVICAGHLGGHIEEFVGDGSAFGCNVRYSFDGEQPLGTGGALRRALPLLGDRFLTIYGDSYLRAPFAPIWESFLASNKAALMTVFRNDNRWDKSNVEFESGATGGKIIRYHKGAQGKYEAEPSSAGAMLHIDYGLGCIRTEALLAWAAAVFPNLGSFDLAAFYHAMLERHELAAFEVKERFYEIGSPAGLAETDALLTQLAQQGARR